MNKDVANDEDDDVGNGDNDWMKNGSPYNAATGMCKSHWKIDSKNCNLRNNFESLLGLIFLESLTVVRKFGKFYSDEQSFLQQSFTKSCS